MSIDDRIRQALEQELPIQPVTDPGALAEQITEAARHQFPDLFEFEASKGYEFGDGGPVPTEDADLEFADVDSSYEPQGDAKTLGGSADHSYPLERGDGTTEDKSAGGGSGSGIPMLAVAGIVAGGLAGILIALSIGGPSPVSSATLGLDGVPVYACPGEGEAGTLHRGDRIFIVGQSGGWLAVRNVRGSGEVVFVETRYVIPDEDTSGLPERNCDPAGTLTIGDLEDTTTTTDPTDETTTTVPGATTTTAPGATTTTQAVTTTTAAPDTTAPVIGNASVNPNTIGHEPPYCPPPHVATVSAFVTDNVGVTQVRAIWTIPGLAQEIRTMAHAGGGTYSAQIGPYEWPEDDVDDGAHLVTVTIEARDAAGNLATAPTSFTFRSAEDCIG
jgi:hypothetical protein